MTVGWCGGECDGVFLQQLSMSAHPLEVEIDLSLKTLILIQTMVFILKLLFVSIIGSLVRQRYEREMVWRRMKGKSGRKEKEFEGDGFQFCFFLTV